jgi:putative glycosyltransferase
MSTSYQTMKLSIVTTLFRSAPHLAEFHARMTAAVTPFTKDYEILLVNDGSPDESQEVGLALCRNDPHVGLIELSRNFGHHKAMMTGLAHARGELVFLIDCDLEEAPELFEQCHRTMQATGADVVYGVQQRRRGRWLERVCAGLYYRVFNLLCDERLPENVLTARLMTHRYVRSLVRHREREVCIGGLWVITGFRQVPLTVEKRTLCTTTYSLSHKVAVMVNHLTAFSNRPLVYIFYLGCLIMLLSGGFGTYLVARRLAGRILEGWASIMVSLWFLGGLILFCIGIVGIYLAKMFSEVKQRPYTIVRERYGIARRQGSRRRRRRLRVESVRSGQAVTGDASHLQPKDGVAPVPSGTRPP